MADFANGKIQAFVGPQELGAPDNLEQVIVENMASASHGDAKRRAETRKLVKMAGDLFLRARLEKRAEAILTRGECWAAAAEIALRGGREERAAELRAGHGK